MGSEGKKRLWQVYIDLKIWSRSAASLNVFQVQDCSMEDSETNVPSDSRDTSGASNRLRDYVTITGHIRPLSEPFRNQDLKIEIQVPSTYPHKPPSVYLKIAMRHPNIDKDGKICTDLLEVGKKWEAMALSDVVKFIVALLDKPEDGHVVDAEAGSLYHFNRTKYNEQITEAVTNKRSR